MENESEENTQNDINDESHLEIVETDETSKIFNQPIADSAKDNEHSVNDDTIVTERSTEISRVAAEEYSERTSRKEEEISLGDVEEDTDIIENEKNDGEYIVSERAGEETERIEEENFSQREGVESIRMDEEERTSQQEGEESIRIDKEERTSQQEGEERIKIDKEGRTSQQESEESIRIDEEGRTSQQEGEGSIRIDEEGRVSQQEGEESIRIDEEDRTSQQESEGSIRIDEEGEGSIRIDEEGRVSQQEGDESIRIDEEGRTSQQEGEESIRIDEEGRMSLRENKVSDKVNEDVEIVLLSEENNNERIDKESGISQMVDKEIEIIDEEGKISLREEVVMKKNYEENKIKTEQGEDKMNTLEDDVINDKSVNVVEGEVNLTETSINADNKLLQGEKEKDVVEESEEMNQNEDGIKSERPFVEKQDPKKAGITNFFTVHTQLDDGSVKNQLVTIVRSKCKKVFLGGYRHKVSGNVYHHAAVQTMPKPRPPPKVQLFSRDTQTFQLKHQKINTENTTSTQMTMPGFFVSNITDKLMAPKQYETADQYQERILQNIVIIQKYYRRWLAKQVVDEKRKQRDDRLNWEVKDKERKQKEKEERIQNEYKRRMHPKTKADFDLLYNDLEKWREEQLWEIDNSHLSSAEKKAKKALLLEEETDLLAAIDRHKIDRKEETKTDSVQKLLSKAAAPKSWKDTKGRKIEMDTQFTIRSRELLEIFNSLNMQYLTPDERLDVLLTLKHTVKEHDCKLTKDIVDLIDREADLIMRNVKDASLVGLRKRIATLFLQYCKTPTFNPQISSLLKVPSDPSVLSGDINYCKYCGRYLRSTNFSLSTKSSKLTICKSCARKDNQSRNRQDYSHYRRILKEIQMNEQQINDCSKVAFIFKQNDVKSLIESVWDGKSVMSGCDDLDELVFIRWDYRDHWSPWNTIFLTKDEADAHVKVTDLSDTYSNVLINRIVQKHVIARNLFGSLEKMIGDFQLKTSNATVAV